jgi:D-tyrosyl-tRNA(Tyr) deacylase
MRAVVQRVRQASVVVAGETVAAIRAGLLVYLGVGTEDTADDSALLAEKVRFLRVFPDEEKPLNRDVVEAGGEVIVVSAFTTMADARKGRRPALTGAAEPGMAEKLYLSFCDELGSLGVEVGRGRFREHMDVVSTNDGPICILLDSKRLF